MALLDVPERCGFHQVGERPPFGLGGSDERLIGQVVQPHGECFRHDRAPSFVIIVNINECAATRQASENLRVGPADDFTLRCGLKVDRGFSPEKAENNLLIEVRVGEEARFHGWELGTERRAASSLA